ncbi:hypothetical protein AGR2A_Lc20002 [Agrobacterium genomosp. 2 str. CFBP 5494]|uniref:Uncharacterized protein n=1 Tax=Agrobacterium genomosp. 2 str. CFBP 5494 TaxID=1183436 RepID=A0A9W5B3T2_9HYPH|nr:hypothetical protein AGR2A_Lc20002 [Agrobacterium genomosp. 2 str. CFBP 5494]
MAASRYIFMLDAVAMNVRAAVASK